MQKLIETLKAALNYDEDLLTALHKESHLTWQADYPVALVHRENRVKEIDTLNTLKENGILDKGYTANDWKSAEIKKMLDLAANYVKTVSMLVHKGEMHERFTFKEKRAGDYWKKVVDDGSFVATLEVSKYKEGAGLCQIEADLRDLMRSSKEVPSLKEIGYIWVVEAPMEIEIDRILAHYYQKNWMMVVGKQKIVYLGWHERLGSVNMRHFVCPPK